MFLVRKITRAKWDKQPGLADREIAADAITGDLRTQGNTLSFWRCRSGTDRDTDEAALAIAAGSDRLDKLDLVWLDDDELKTDGHTLRDTPGLTPARDLVDRHVDVANLDYTRLGRVATHVAAAIEAHRFRRLQRARVRELLSTAVDQGRIDLDALKSTLREEIET